MMEIGRSGGKKKRRRKCCLIFSLHHRRRGEKKGKGGVEGYGGNMEKGACMGSREAGVFSRTFPGAKKDEEEVPSSFFGSQDIRPPFPASFLLPLLFPFPRSRGIFPPPRALPMT